MQRLHCRNIGKAYKWCQARLRIPHNSLGCCLEQSCTIRNTRLFDRSGSILAHNMLGTLDQLAKPSFPEFADLRKSVHIAVLVPVQSRLGSLLMSRISTAWTRNAQLMCSKLLRSNMMEERALRWGVVVRYHHLISLLFMFVSPTECFACILLGYPSSRRSNLCLGTQIRLQ